MSTNDGPGLARRLAEAEATIAALLSGEIDAVVDPASQSPVLLSKAQADLRESETRCRQIVETTSDGIVKVDRDGVILFANRQFADMLGYQPAEMVGVSVFAFMSPAAKVLSLVSLERRRLGVREAVDATYLHKSGAEISVNVAGSPLVDADGAYVGSLDFVRDVTEQKKLQRQLMVSDRMASVGTLAAGVAHEINNPLAALLGNLEVVGASLDALLVGDPAMAQERRTDAWLLAYVKAPLDDARNAAERVRSIVRDLKIFSHAPTEELKTVVDVRATLESALRMAWNEIRHRARLVKSFGPVPTIVANEARLGQVFLNLLVNAAQALQEGQAEHNEIRVSTALVAGRVVVEVHDTGPGIPPEIIDRVFDAFFTTKPVGAGTGLGLAICMSIVSSMGGTLGVTSERGRGTTFRVTLPVTTGAEADPTRPIGAAPAAGPRSRVLVVDDEPLVLRVMQRMLRADHDLVTAGAADEALGLIAGGAWFDVVLCDLMMPDMTGMDFHRELTRVAPEQAERVIFVTGGAFTPAATAFLASTPNAKLEKPFTQADLRSVIRRLQATGSSSRE